MMRADFFKLLLRDDALSLVNTNFPHEKPRGMMWTRQSIRLCDGKVLPGEDPMGSGNFGCGARSHRRRGSHFGTASRHHPAPTQRKLRE